MNNPKYLQEIAYIFGDPLLENTGLEGGTLKEALDLMRSIINDTFLQHFPNKRTLLKTLSDKILQCSHYIALTHHDRQNGTNQALRKITDDIKKLSFNDWLIIPGGWHCRTKSGHAMLYLLMPGKQFVVINTGSGSTYHAKKALPHEIQVHFLHINDFNVDQLVDLALPALIDLLTKPRDYYSPSLLYEVLIPLIGGKLETEINHEHAYSLQMAGTCFWQCVDKLLFYFFRDEIHTYLKMKAFFEKKLFEKVFHELQRVIDGSDRINDVDLNSAPWETYCRLILFAARSFSGRHIQSYDRDKLDNEEFQMLHLLDKLSKFSKGLLSKQISQQIEYDSLETQPWTIDSRFTLFEGNYHEPRALYNPLPNFNNLAQAEIFLESLRQIVQYIDLIKINDREHIVDAHYLLENFLINLPLPKTDAWGIFARRKFSASEIDVVATNLSKVIGFYYRMHSVLHSEPSPKEYTKQIIAGFSGFFFFDAFIRMQNDYTFLRKYAFCLTDLISHISLKTIAPHLTVESPKLSQRLKELFNTMESLSGLKKIFDFELNTSWFHKYLIKIKKNNYPMDKNFLEDCLIGFNKKDKFYSQSQERALEHRIAEAIIDLHNELLPLAIHQWRNIGIYARLLFTGFIIEEKIIFRNQSLWGFGIVVDRKNETYSLQISFSFPSNTKKWHKFSTKLISDEATTWLCDNEDSVAENQVLISAMPKSNDLGRRLFNILAEIGIGKNLQIYSTLDLFSKKPHLLQLTSSQILLEKYLFEAGPLIFQYGSLLQKESSIGLKLRLLDFMNKSEYYFAGRVNRLPAYLKLIKHFLNLESFLIYIGPRQLHCHTIYHKLHHLLVTQDEYHYEISAHLILLFQNYVLTNGMPQEDITVINRISFAWGCLLKNRILDEDVSPDLYHQAKAVLLSLQNKILNLTSRPDMLTKLMSQFMKGLFSYSLENSIPWKKISGSQGCFQAGKYFINFFDGRVYVNGSLLIKLPEAIMGNADYHHLFKKKTLAIETERSTKKVRVYRSIDKVERKITFYLYDKEPDGSNIIETKHYQFRERQYGLKSYPDLISCKDIYSAYSPVGDFVTQQIGLKSYSSKNKNAGDSGSDVIFHEELAIGSMKCWAQFIPRWRLKGMLPSALIDKHDYWLLCTQSLNSDFIEIEGVESIEISNDGNKQTLFILDNERKVKHLVYLFSNNKIRLFKLDDRGNAIAEWIDLLRLPKSSNLSIHLRKIFKFELPTYILGWKRLEDNSIYIELMRHQLQFEWNPRSNVLESIGYAGYKIVNSDEMPVDDFSYYFLMKNSYNEYKILLVHLHSVKQGFLKNDPLNARISSDLSQLESPSYFAYRFSEEFKQLVADTIESEQYLILLYVKLRKYSQAFLHIRNSWKDQLMSGEEWRLFYRFFQKTQKDKHPDLHACRLQYYSLYLPIYVLLNERQKAKNILAEEEREQLTLYKSMINKFIIDDYKNYLVKWIYVRKKLRLSEDMEKQLLNKINAWGGKLPTLLTIRKQCLVSPLGFTLKQQKLLHPYEVQSVFNLRIFNLEAVLKNYYIFRADEVDHFGYIHDEKRSFSSSFLYLYQSYIESKIKPQQLRTTLIVIAWSNNLSSDNVSELALFNGLIAISYYAPSTLPKLPIKVESKTKVNFSCQNASVNLTQESRDMATWFRNFLNFARNSHHKNLTTMTMNMSYHYIHSFLKLNPSEVMPNTLPKFEPPMAYFQIGNVFSLNQFHKEYQFDPQKPLKHIFLNYFSFHDKELNLMPSPIETDQKIYPEYTRSMKENLLCSSLVERFTEDYALYISWQPMVHSEKNPHSLFDLEKELLRFQKNV